MATDNGMLVDLTADIVLAHVSNNSVATQDVAGLIKTVYASLQGLGAPVEVEAAKPVPAVSIRASIKPTHLVSMIDGQPYTMLKRHLAKNGYTPQSVLSVRCELVSTWYGYRLEGQGVIP